MLDVIDTFPAYTIVRGLNEYADGDEFAIGFESRRHGRLYNFYTLGSVEGYAARYGEDTEEAVASAKANGHKLYWANPQGAMITSDRQAHRVVRGINHGDTITFKGKSFRVEPAPNNNVYLIEA